MEAPLAFCQGIQNLNFNKLKNRRRLYEVARQHSNLMDPVHVIVFFNQGKTNMLTFPEEPFQNWPVNLRHILMRAIFILHTDIDFNTEHKIIITCRMITKYVEMYQSATFWNKFYLDSLPYQPNNSIYSTNERSVCNLYNPVDFKIPSLRRIVMVYLHRNVGFHELISLNKTRIHYHARDYVLSRISNNCLPKHLMNELIHMNGSCSPHFTSMIMNTGAKLNKYHLMVKHNSELHSCLLNINTCIVPFQNKILSRIEAMVLVNEVIKTSEKFDKQKFKEILKTGFIVLNNYDPFYNDHYYD